MPKVDGVTAVAVVLIASFAIDRIVTGILFLLGFLGAWKRRFPDPSLQEDPAARADAEKRQKLLYFCLAGLLSIPLLAGLGKVRILAAVGFQTDPIFDIIVTGLILMGGSDRVAELLKMHGGGVEKSEPRPITINGKLVLEGGGPSPSAGQ